MTGLDALAKWYQEGREPPGGWRPGWLAMVKKYIRTGKAPKPSPKKKPPVKEVSPEVQHARLTACSFCDHLRQATRTCGLCGCGAPIDNLVKRPWHQCPDGRWTRTIASL